MPITLEPNLQTKLDETAQRLGMSADDFAAEAIRMRLQELDSRALDDEERAYQQLYPELRQRFSRQYVAIYGGQVVGADSDFEELFLRVKQQLNGQAVLIRQVTDNPVEEYHFRSPRLDKPL
jgi:hypothetical protein